MSSFKLYLPSNASKDHFPDNSATNYRTNFHRPINLEGKWEVGVESIFYSSLDYNQDEEATIDYEIKASKTITLNEKSRQAFVVTDDNLWSGLRGFALPTFYKPKDTLNIIYQINSMNKVILSSRNFNLYGNIFTFQFHKDGRIMYTSDRDDFTLRIHPLLAKALGYEFYQNIFTGEGPLFAASKPPAVPKELKGDHFSIEFFVKEFVFLERRIILKNVADGPLDVKKNLLTKWDWLVPKHYKCRLSFSKSNKLIIHSYGKKYIFCFSIGFRKRFAHPNPIIGKDTRWAMRAVDEAHDHKNEIWAVEIYSHELAVEEVPITIQFDYHLRPRQFATVHDLLDNINQMSAKKMKEILHKNTLNVDLTVHFKVKDKKCHLSVGSNVKLTLSEVLTNMLGFTSREFSNIHLFATYSLTSKSFQQQRLYIVSNFTRDIAVGERRVSILQDFLHTLKGKGMVERRFHPITYMSLTTNFLDTAHIQLTDGNFNPVIIHDSHTLIILHFRRMQV